MVVKKVKSNLTYFIVRVNFCKNLHNFNLYFILNDTCCAQKSLKCGLNAKPDSNFLFFSNAKSDLSLYF